MRWDILIEGVFGGASTPLGVPASREKILVSENGETLAWIVKMGLSIVADVGGFAEVELLEKGWLLIFRLSVQSR